MTIRELGKLLRSRRVSCLELTQQTLADLKTRDVFRAMITLTEEHALQEASKRDQEFAAGVDRGPLHGIPTAHKDIFYTRGIPTTGGSLLYRNFIPDHDATVVERLNKAGAICVGKANLHELAYGATSKNPHYGAVLNPHNTGHITGGSSGGSAALVAAKLLPFSLGTDTGGSIRIPASYCGVFGLKPTYGRVSRYGVLPLAFSLDHVGPLASSAEDCALVMKAIAGPDPKDPTCSRLQVPDFADKPTSTLKGVRVGIPQNFFFHHVDEAVAAAVMSRAALMEDLGAEVHEVRVPDMEEASLAARVIQFSEATSLYTGYDDGRMFGDDVWALIEQGRMIRGYEYVNAQRLRTVFRREFNKVWRSIDVLVAPATPTAAPKQEDTVVRFGDYTEDVRIASTRLCRPINFLGEPSLSVPCGMTDAGLPMGMQLIGPPFQEAKLLQIAELLQT